VVKKERKNDGSGHFILTGPIKELNQELERLKKFKGFEIFHGSQPTNRGKYSAEVTWENPFDVDIAIDVTTI
jgi:hypothetical protein